MKVETEIDNVLVYIEVEDDDKDHDYSGDVRSSGRTSENSPGGGVKENKKDIFIMNAFKKATELMSAIAKECIQNNKNSKTEPDEFEIEYSLSLDIETQVWVIKAGKPSNFTVRMKWNK